jgi:glycosyltransferase involved in cell wall biosynthesis
MVTYAPAAPPRLDWCDDHAVRVPAPPGEPIRVVELVATGTNGGAQEQVFNLLSRIDRQRYDVRVISLSDGSSVKKWRGLGFPVEVVANPDDAAAAREVTALLEAWQTQVLHGHMYRAEIIGTRAVRALAAKGRPRPFLVNTVHSGRIRPAADRALLRQLTPDMDRLIAVSHSIVRKLRREGRSGAPVQLIYNGVDLDRYDAQEACCTLPEEYGFEPGAPLVGVVARLEPEKGHATLLEAWPSVLARVPEARLLGPRSWASSESRARGMPAWERGTHDRARRSSSPAAVMTFRPLPRRLTSPCCPRTARPRAW